MELSLMIMAFVVANSNTCSISWSEYQLIQSSKLIPTVAGFLHHIFKPSCSLLSWKSYAWMQRFISSPPNYFRSWDQLSSGWMSQTNYS